MHLLFLLTFILVSNAENKDAQLKRNAWQTCLKKRQLQHHPSHLLDVIVLAHSIQLTKERKLKDMVLCSHACPPEQYTELLDMSTDAFIHALRCFIAIRTK